VRFLIPPYQKQIWHAANYSNVGAKSAAKEGANVRRQNFDALTFATVVDFILRI